MRGLLIVLAALLMAALYAACDADAGLGSWLRMRSELGDAQARIAQARRTNQRLRGEADALERDAFAIERAIREDLGLARPGETVLRWRRSEDSNPRFP